MEIYMGPKTINMLIFEKKEHIFTSHQECVCERERERMSLVFFPLPNERMNKKWGVYSLSP